MKQLITAITLTAAGLTLTQTAIAGDPVAGKQKSAVCATCHGADGNSPSPAFPTLAGQYQDYLEKSLKDYRSGARQNAIMAGFATSLSDEDIADLAAFYASQSGLEVVKKP